ncbi:MAG TPA: AMP-binding protein [Candidatus Polarisedimenticolaceae bacterium]
MEHLYALFAATAARFPDRVAVELQRADALERVTYRELDAMGARVAGRLSVLGVTPGDRVALLADNDARWCAAFLGIQRLGAVAVPLDTNYRPAQIATVVADCGARVLLAGPRGIEAARAAVPGVPVEGLPVEADGPLPPPHASTPDAPAVILYTSGTTADPKGVVLTHANLVAEREAAFSVVTVDETDVVLSVLPLFHALALLANLLLPFAVGARVVFLETVNSAELSRALAERGITAFCCVPQFFYLIHQRVEQEVARRGAAARAIFRALRAAHGALRGTFGINAGRFLFGRVHAALGPRMRLLVTGGSRFDPAVGRDLARLGIDVLEAYGLTECAGAATITRPGDGGVGRPLPGVEVRIAPRESEAGDGEVLLRGPIVMRGYWNRPDANAATLRGGWLHTGDLGFLDDRGALHVTGRSKDVIILASGKNIYPEEVEAAYLKSPFIKELCVVPLARPGDPVAERLHAVVVPDQEVMRAHRIVNMNVQIRWEIEKASLELPSHKRVLSYDLRLEDLPRTTTRKLRRFEIEREVRARSASSPPPAAPPTIAAGWEPEAIALLEVVAEVAKPGSTLAPESNLELDLGLDSMERVELRTRLEHAAGGRIADETAARIYTLGELIRAVLEAAGDGIDAGEPGLAWDRLFGELPEDDPTLTALLKPRRLQTIGWFVLTRALRAAAAIATGFRASGVERLPASGAFVICPNHQSYLDVFLLAGALPYRVFRRMFFVGASEYFRSTWRLRAARALHVVPVDPDAHLVRAMKAGAWGLRHGKVLILFPEGERSVDGAPKAFKKGAAILARHLDVPIVPVALDGVDALWPPHRPFRWGALLPHRRARVRVEFGEPLRAAGAGEASYTETTERLRSAVVASWERLRAGRT